MGVGPRTLYICSDGQEFESLPLAEQHEARHEVKVRVCASDAWKEIVTLARNASLPQVEPLMQYVLELAASHSFEAGRVYERG